MKNSYKRLGVQIPEILLPAKGTDLTRWSVIACDQYTAQPDYWLKVAEEVGDSPSTLKLTFPEVYLKDDDREERINRINETMVQYMANGVLELQKAGFILVDRSTPHAASRKGLIIAVDLECYDYRAGSQALIRATEGTVLDRIPPRVKIRENAPIELPHIMLLIDDPEKTVIEKLYEQAGDFEKLYDFELMQGGGHIRGWKVEDAQSLALVAAALEKLADPAAFDKKYSPEHGDSTHGANRPDNSTSGVLLFAVGDGNHSLASAKAHWENVKAALPQEEISSHPARYALVEVVNVHDDGLVFEPIHRLLFGVNSSTVLEKIMSIANSDLTSRQDHEGRISAEYTLYDSKASMEAAIDSMKSSKPRSTHLLPFILEGTFGLITVHNAVSSLEVGTLQCFIDELIKNEPGMEVDYIHGEQVVTGLGSQKGSMGFYLSVMDKHDLFRTVIRDGVLPRKTFSMGEAEEKRYYLECRKIR